MTWKSFFRDLKYFASGGLTLFLSNTAIGYAAIYLSEKNVGILKQFPFFLSFIIVLLVYEFFLYWYRSPEP